MAKRLTSKKCLHMKKNVAPKKKIIKRSSFTKLFERKREEKIQSNSDDKTETKNESKTSTNVRNSADSMDYVGQEETLKNG